MFKNIICGAARFQYEEDDPTSPLTPKSPSTPTSGGKNRSNKKKKNTNPYSDRGLDKFSKVVADLDERRQKIYSQLSSPELSVVRFGYSYSRDWKPIVVKLKDPKAPDHSEVHVHMDDRKESNKEPTTPHVAQVKNGDEVRKDVTTTMEKKKGLLSLDGLWKPYYYFSTLVMLILVCLAIYGRAFAILCTSMWWYLGPIVKCEEENYSRFIKKKVYVRKFMSEKKIESDAVRLSSLKSRSLGHGGHLNYTSWS